MKALTSVKVKKGKPGELREWVSAAEQATDAGRNEFWERQQERMRIAAQSATVTKLKRRA